MKPTGSPYTAAIFASAAAGPLFVLSLAAASVYLDLPEPIFVDGAMIAAGAVILFFAALVGFFLSIVPNLVGSILLQKLGDRVELVRIPAFWTLTGGLIGLSLVAAAQIEWDPELPTAFALVFTSAACARICRQQMLWPWGWGQA